MAHEPPPGHGQPDQDPLSGGPAAERGRPATPDGFVTGPAAQSEAGADWDQDAALDALVAAVEAGRVLIPPDDDEMLGIGDAVPAGAAGPAGATTMHDGPAAGFASGGVLDAALPGPGVAGSLDAVAGSDRRYTGVDDDALIGMLVKWQQTEAWAASGKLSAAAELIRRRPGDARPDAAPGVLRPEWGKFCDDELAVATATSKVAAGKTLTLAYDLAARLPGTAQALREGVIDSYKAQIIADAARILDDAAAAAADALILPAIAGKTPGQIRVAAARAVLSADPDAARLRRERAQRDARVELWREDAGTAALCGYGLPPDAALAADQAISTRARELKAAGLAGTMDQLRVRAYLDFLLGKDSLADPGTGSPPAAHDDVTDGDQPGRGGDNVDRPRPSPDSPDQPGPGPDGAGQPGSCPDGAGQSGPDPDGPGQPGRCPDGADRPGNAAGTAGGAAGTRGARAGDPAGFAARINLTIPLATLLGLAERPGEAAGFGAIDPDLARTLAAGASGNPATTWCITVTGEHGHPAGHGCARRTPRTRASDSSPPGNNPGPPGNDPSPPGNGPCPPGNGPGPPGNDPSPPGNDPGRPGDPRGTPSPGSRPPAVAAARRPRSPGDPGPGHPADTAPGGCTPGQTARH